MKLAELLDRRRNSLKWFKKQNDIVKYKPEGYNEEGVYTLDEWTDYSEIGRSFSGKVLTMEEYELVENDYINCVMDIIQYVNIKYLRISLFGRKRVIRLKNKSYKEGSRIKAEDIRPILRANLRNEYGCALVNVKRDFQVDFGWDYYMHVVCLIPHDELEKIVTANHLYLNPRVVRKFWKFYDDQDDIRIYFVPNQDDVTRNRF